MLDLDEVWLFHTVTWKVIIGSLFRFEVLSTFNRPIRPSPVFTQSRVPGGRSLAGVRLVLKAVKLAHAA